MYLSRLELDPRCPEVRRDLGDCHELHRTLLRAFPQVDTSEVGARSKCGVLYRIETSRGVPLVYVQSRIEPDWSRLPARYFDDRHRRPGGNPAVREVAGAYRSLDAGRVLRFRMLANPTRKIKRDPTEPGGPVKKTRVPLRGEDQRRNWLNRKAEAGGFRVLESRFDDAVPDLREAGEVRYRGRKRGRGRGTKITFEGVIFEGRIEVTDPVRFFETIAAGIGSGKAYGFGLLTLAGA